MHRPTAVNEEEIILCGEQWGSGVEDFNQSGNIRDPLYPFNNSRTLNIEVSGRNGDDHFFLQGCM